MAPPPLEAGDRLVVEAAALAHPAEDKGWTGLATTVSAAGCAEVARLPADQEQHTTVEPGLRWLKKPAALAPVGLEQPARMAALARLTGWGCRVYSVIPRPVRRYLRTQAQPLPGNTGLTATPTAAVVLALLAPVALVHVWLEAHEVVQLAGVQAPHRLVCDALGLDSSWSAVP